MKNFFGLAFVVAVLMTSGCKNPSGDSDNVASETINILSRTVSFELKDINRTGEALIPGAGYIMSGGIEDGIVLSAREHGQYERVLSDGTTYTYNYDNIIPLKLEFFSHSMDVVGDPLHSEGGAQVALYLQEYYTESTGNLLISQIIISLNPYLGSGCLGREIPMTISYFDPENDLDFSFDVGPITLIPGQTLNMSKNIARSSEKTLLESINQISMSRLLNTYLDLSYINGHIDHQKVLYWKDEMATATNNIDLSHTCPGGNTNLVDCTFYLVDLASSMSETNPDAPLTIQDYCIAVKSVNDRLLSLGEMGLDLLNSFMDTEGITDLPRMPSNLSKTTVYDESQYLRNNYSIPVLFGESALGEDKSYPSPVFEGSTRKAWVFTGDYEFLNDVMPHPNYGEYAASLAM